jgi:hypothetical protein
MKPRPNALGCRIHRFCAVLSRTGTRRPYFRNDDIRIAERRRGLWVGWTADVFGETPLQGTIVGHERPLPAALVACANCHPAGSRAALKTAIGPRLDKSTTDTGRRRGGPPSRFTSTTFCRLLRTGVDPAYIVISRQMPRYDLRDDQCFSLWQYLVGLGDEVRRE